jgi:hypothetical protein
MEGTKDRKLASNSNERTRKRVDRKTNTRSTRISNTIKPTRSNVNVNPTDLQAEISNTNDSTYSKVSVKPTGLQTEITNTTKQTRAIVNAKSIQEQVVLPNSTKPTRSKTSVETKRALLPFSTKKRSKANANPTKNRVEISKTTKNIVIRKPPLKPTGISNTTKITESKINVKQNQDLEEISHTRPVRLNGDEKPRNERTVNSNSNKGRRSKVSGKTTTKLIGISNITKHTPSKINVKETDQQTEISNDIKPIRSKADNNQSREQAVISNSTKPKRSKVSVKPNKEWTEISNSTRRRLSKADVNVAQKAKAKILKSAKKRSSNINRESESARVSNSNKPSSSKFNISPNELQTGTSNTSKSVRSKAGVKPIEMHTRVLNSTEPIRSEVSVKPTEEKIVISNSTQRTRLEVNVKSTEEVAVILNSTKPASLNVNVKESKKQAVISKSIKRGRSKVNRKPSTKRTDISNSTKDIFAKVNVNTTEGLAENDTTPASSKTNVKSTKKRAKISNARKAARSKVNRKPSKNRAEISDLTNFIAANVNAKQIQEQTMASNITNPTRSKRNFTSNIKRSGISNTTIPINSKVNVKSKEERAGHLDTIQRHPSKFNGKPTKEQRQNQYVTDADHSKVNGTSIIDQDYNYIASTSLAEKSKHAPLKKGSPVPDKTFLLKKLDKSNATSLKELTIENYQKNLSLNKTVQATKGGKYSSMEGADVKTKNELSHRSYVSNMTFPAYGKKDESDSIKINKTLKIPKKLKKKRRHNKDKDGGGKVSQHNLDKKQYSSLQKANKSFKDMQNETIKSIPTSPRKPTKNTLPRAKKKQLTNVEGSKMHNSKKPSAGKNITSAIKSLPEGEQETPKQSPKHVINDKKSTRYNSPVKNINGATFYDTSVEGKNKYVSKDKQTEGHVAKQKTSMRKDQKENSRVPFHTKTPFLDSNNIVNETANTSLSQSNKQNDISVSQSFVLSDRVLGDEVAYLENKEPLDAPRSQDKIDVTIEATTTRELKAIKPSSTSFLITLPSPIPSQTLPVDFKSNHANSFSNQSVQMLSKGKITPTLPLNFPVSTAEGFLDTQPSTEGPFKLPMSAVNGFLDTQPSAEEPFSQSLTSVTNSGIGDSVNIRNVMQNTTKTSPPPKAAIVEKTAPIRRDDITHLSPKISVFNLITNKDAESKQQSINSFRSRKYSSVNKTNVASPMPPPPVIPTATVATATEKIIQFIGKASDLVKKLNGKKKKKILDLLSHSSMDHLSGNTLEPYIPPKVPDTQGKTFTDKAKSDAEMVLHSKMKFRSINKPEKEFGNLDKDLGKGQSISEDYKKIVNGKKRSIKASAFDSDINNSHRQNALSSFNSGQYLTGLKTKSDRPFVEWLARRNNLLQSKGLPPKIPVKPHTYQSLKKNSSPNILRSNLNTESYISPLPPLVKPPYTAPCNTSLGKEEVMSLAVNVLRLLVSNLKLQQALQRSQEKTASTHFHNQKYLLIPLPTANHQTNRTNFQANKSRFPSTSSIQKQIEAFLRNNPIQANMAREPLVKRMPARKGVRTKLFSNIGQRVSLANGRKLKSNIITLENGDETVRDKIFNTLSTNDAQSNREAAIRLINRKYEIGRVSSKENTRIKFHP